MTKWNRLTPGVYHEEPLAFADVPQIGRVIAVSASGAMVVVDAMPGQSYGPAPWSLGEYATPALAITAGFYPNVGDSVLLVFAGVGVQAPVVTAWWR